MYNGELWNYVALREELRALGDSFRTTSDTEVPLHAWAAWGPACLPRLHGMFAFALWDGEHGWLVKDRWGKCPLAIGSWPGSLDFASERKALRFGLGVPDECIEELPPGSLLRADAAGGILEQRRWFDLRVAPVADPPAAAAERVAALLRDGVQARMMSDVPVCTLLSGGLDSLFIACYARQLMGDVTAFTAVMDPASPDLRAARDAAAYLEIRLVEVPVQVEPSAAGLLAALREGIWHAEVTAPAQVQIAVACRALARAIRERGFKVVFSGEGSDELWGTYRPVHILRRNPRAWQEARQASVVGQWRKNFPRCNKVFLVFLSEGVE